MKLVDANVLLYAVDQHAEKHAVARAWLDSALSDHETVLIPWVCLLAFVRISTHHAIYQHPLTAAQALGIVEAWLSQPPALAPVPDGSHPNRLLSLLEATGLGGNLTNDAYIAALALQYGATVVSFDSDFARFPGVSWQLPD